MAKKDPSWYPGKIEYPKVKYHAIKGTVTVQSATEEKALGWGWKDRPIVSKPPGPLRRMATYIAPTMREFILRVAIAVTSALVVWLILRK